MGMTTEANLKFLSIAVGSNLPNFTPKCWVRRNLSPKEEKRVIRVFIDELEKLAEQKRNAMPLWLHEGLERIEDEILVLSMKKINKFMLNKLINFKRILNNLLKLDVFGYNSR